MMKRLVIAGCVLTVLAACQPAVPDSGVGVGFGDYGTYDARSANRDAALAGNATAIPAPTAVQSTPLDATGASGDPVTAAAAAALGESSDRVSARPGNAAPQLVNTPGGISDENNFDAVSGERTIQDDAALLAQNRAQYQVVQPTALPSREGSGVSIVAYALETSHPVGEKVWRRGLFATDAKAQRECAQFRSADLAQEAFLEQGGPRRDKLGLDPDGDGYACNWSPVRFRQAKQG